MTIQEKIERKYTVIETDIDGYKRSYELTLGEVLENLNKEVSEPYLEHEDWQYGWNEYMECDWQSIPELVADKKGKRAMKLLKEMKQEMADDLAKLVKEQDFARRQIQHYEAQMVELEILIRHSK